jgi:thiosulfate reductase cytochrome b subunit
VQFQGLMVIFYDFQGARLVHFLAMAAIALFILIHVTLAVLVPRTIKAMITGRVRVKVKPIGAMPATGE